MAETIKLIGSEMSLTTANTVGTANIVRVYAAANALITVADGVTTIGTCTLPAGTVEYFVKTPTQTIASNVAVLATKVAFT
jgi:hypothetical protein